jgi:G3E family GTPase
MLAYDFYIYTNSKFQNLVQTLHKQLAELLIQTKGKCNWKIDQDSSNVFLKVHQELQTTEKKKWKDTIIINQVATLITILQPFWKRFELCPLKL